MRFDPLEKLTMVALMESIKKVNLFHSLLFKVRIFLEQPSHVDKVNFVPGQKKESSGVSQLLVLVLARRTVCPISPLANL